MTEYKTYFTYWLLSFQRFNHFSWIFISSTKLIVENGFIDDWYEHV